MLLSLIRHAKSSWHDTSLPDIVRPLNDRGKEALHLISAQLQQKKCYTTLLYCSPATRALHTAIAICDSIGYPKNKIITNSAIYYGEVNDIINLLNTHHHEPTITIVGHEPLLSDLCDYIYGDSPAKFSTAAIANIQMNIQSWKDDLHLKGKLISFITPKELIAH